MYCDKNIKWKCYEQEYNNSINLLHLQGRCFSLLAVLNSFFNESNSEVLS